MMCCTYSIAEEPASAGAEEAEDAAASELVELVGFGDSTLTDAQLGEQRARENVELATVTINDQQQEGVVSDNLAIGNENGDNLINGSAFADSAGYLSTVQNTGNNVLIQNSTIINVSVDAAAGQ